MRKFKVHYKVTNRLKFPFVPITTIDDCALVDAPSPEVAVELVKVSVAEAFAPYSFLHYVFHLTDVVLFDYCPGVSE